jgi:hypothetical protein
MAEFCDNEMLPSSRPQDDIPQKKTNSSKVKGKPGRVTKRAHKSSIDTVTSGRVMKNSAKPKLLLLILAMSDLRVQS